MRFSGVGVTISSADRSTGNHAFGFAAATVGHRRQQLAELRGGTRRAPTPRWPRRALSKIANVSHAWNTSCATSAGWNGASHGNGRFSAGLKLYVVALAPLLVRAAASPAPRRRSTSARSSSPPQDRAPPAPAPAPAASCRRCPSSTARAARSPSRAGEPRRRVVVLPRLAVHDLRGCRARSSTVAHRRRCRRPRAARPPPTSPAARARPRSPTSSGCHVRCPTPMMHGVRGSTRQPATTSPASSACASPRTPSALPWRPRSGRSSS